MNIKNALSINQLELELFLGWPDDERLRKQKVLLDIHLSMGNIPKACQTDDLEDTICYRELIEKLREHFSDKKFHLIEHVTQEIHRLLKSLLPDDTSLSVALSKQPQIDNLGSVTFFYSDIS